MIEIRQATIEDTEKITKIYQSWLEFEGILPDKLCEPDSPAEIEKQMKFGRKYFIAEVDGEPAGVNYIDDSNEYLGTIRLGDLIVKKEFRGQGAGSALVDNVIHYAKERNLKKIWLWAQEKLPDAIKMYEKKGFFLEGRQKSQFCGQDSLIYGLVL